MSDLTVSPALPQPASTPKVIPERIRETAEQFEASFLSQMLKPMFEGLKTDGMFGGGEAEGTWRGFLLDAMAKTTVAAGGIGLAGAVMTEMLKMQESSQ